MRSSSVKKSDVLMSVGSVLIIVVVAFLSSVVYGDVADSDIVGHPNEDALNYMIESDVIEGTVKDRYEPDRTITRDEAVAMMYRFYSANEKFTHVYDISDVGKDDWAYMYVDWAVNEAVSRGVGTDRSGAVIFNPKGVLTREQLVTLQYNYILENNIRWNGDIRVMGYRSVADKDTAHKWAINALEFMEGSNMLQLDQFGNYYPLERATRADFAQLLYTIQANMVIGEQD
jgi:hypothetical protein